MGKDRAFRVRTAVKRLPKSLVEHFQYKLMIDAVTDHAIYMLDPDGVIISWNTGAERLKGYNAREAMGSNFEIFYSEEDRLDGVPRRALQSAAQSGRFAAEGWRIRKDGTKFWASIRIDPIREDGELLGFAKVTRDVSQHRESNLAMENLLERLTLAADSAGIGIWDWDIREDVLIWDDWMFRLYGSSGPTRSITMNYGSGICTPTTAPPPRAPWRTAWSVPSRWTASSALFGTTAASTKSAAPAA